MGGLVMVARNRIRCIVVEVDAAGRHALHGAMVRDLLPWADPYVAGLIRKLQDEVRRERRQKSSVCRRRLAGACWQDIVPDYDELDGKSFCR
jgi:hypothetical protein